MLRNGGDLMPDRSKDWLNQALRDLEQAKDSKTSQRHEWACFASHQAAEKAVKALHLKYKQETWGHMISKLLSELPESISLPNELVDKAKILDNYYIPSRYPNSHPEGAPYEFFGLKQSEEAIKYASEIIEFVRNEMAK
jgi:HEPN domain-containing protein